MQRRAQAGPYRERLRYDPEFLLELRFCNEHGISHSHFLGGPARWTAADRSKALAYLLEDAERCALCGTAPWQWEENKRAFVPVEHFCQGCYAKSYLEEDTGSVPGTTVRLVATGSQEAARRLIKQREAERGRRDAQRERRPDRGR